MKKILIVDDDQSIVEALSLAIEMEGYEVLTAFGGQEALEKANKHYPNLIILDILLSGEDGKNICKELKTKNKTSHIPVILISANLATENSIKECKADAFIAKPFEVSELLSKVENYIAKT